jgi:hypothetical protein
VGRLEQRRGLESTQLAAQLRVFEVCPKQRRTKPDFFGSSKPRRGYERSGFERAWRDYGLIEEVCLKRKAAVVTGVTSVTGLGRVGGGGGTGPTYSNH